MKSKAAEMSVLVVDDEKDIRDACQRILSRMGCRVLSAANGEAALSLLDQNTVAMTLLDLKMPGLDGMEVLRRIHEMDENILVIVITGYATVETAIEAMKRGAYDFIPKPFEPDQLRIVVNRALERVRLTREAHLLEQERKRTLLDLGMEKSRIRTIIEALPDGVVVTNARGQVVLMNPTFLWHLDLPADTQPGRHISEYVDDDGFCEHVFGISQGNPRGVENIPTYEFAVSGDKYLLARGKPVLGEDGEFLGAVVIVVDVTAMKVIDRLKTEYVAKVSHELRSPLSTIHEQLAMILAEHAGEVQSETRILSRAKEKTKGLISLIGDLLDLSRIESGSAYHEPRSVQVEDLLKAILDFMQDRARQNQQSLILDAPPEPLPPLIADPLALESIFGNLITNAMNYTPKGGDITIRIKDLAGERVQVEIADTGFGIEPEYLEKIFERFYRVKNERTRNITGTGLGLPIVKGLVDALEGEITVASQPGKGSCFTVNLPCRVKKKEKKQPRA